MYYLLPQIILGKCVVKTQDNLFLRFKKPKKIYILKLCIIIIIIKKVLKNKIS